MKGMLPSSVNIGPCARNGSRSARDAASLVRRRIGSSRRIVLTCRFHSFPENDAVLSQVGQQLSVATGDRVDIACGGCRRSAFAVSLRAGEEHPALPDDEMGATAVF